MLFLALDRLIRLWKLFSQSCLVVQVQTQWIRVFSALCLEGVHELDSLCQFDSAIQDYWPATDSLRFHAILSDGFPL